MKTGVQLWSVNKECTEDYPGTLRALAEAGFAGIEFAGNLGGYRAVELRQLLEECHLEGIGIHVSLERLIDNLDRELDFATEAGLGSLTIPVVEPEYTDTVDGYKRLGDLLNGIGSHCKQRGIPLYYHNHHAEVRSFGPETGLDLLLRHTDERTVHLELDVGFLAKAGMDSAAFIQKHAKRIGLLHLKDPTGRDNPPFKPLGQGILDVPSVVNAARTNHIPWGIIELGRSDVPGLQGVIAGLRYLQRTAGKL